MKSSRVQVRFSEHIIVHLINTQSPSSSTTWLTPNDFSNIRNGVFTTLDMTKQFGYSTPLSSYYCSRGLEDYSTERKGCLKHSAIQRRQTAIRAVLNEQESQRAQRQRQWQRQKQRIYNNINNICDIIKIRQIYKNQTYSNAVDAICMARIDSEEALAVYSEASTSPTPPQAPEEPTSNMTSTNTNNMSTRTKTSTYGTNFFQMPSKRRWTFTPKYEYTRIIDEYQPPSIRPEFVI